MPNHGTRATYHTGCRCDPCRTAESTYSTQRRRRPLPPDDPRHGTYNAYTHLGCRCDPCRAAGATYNATNRCRCRCDLCQAAHPKPAQM